MSRRLPGCVCLLAMVSLLLPASLGAQIGGSDLSTTRGPVGGGLGGERTYSISGRVLDETTNEGIMGARVAVQGFTGAFYQEAYLDVHGGFMFTDIRRGNYYLIVSHPDYEEKEVHVQVAGMPISGLVISLRPKPRPFVPTIAEPLDVRGHLVPQPARKAFEQGAEEYNRGNLQEALIHFDKALELHAEYVSALHAKGVVHLRLGEVGKAQPCFEKAVELNPNAAAPRVFLGGIYNALRRHQEAREHLERAVQLNPKSGLAHFELSRAYWELQQVEKAEAAVSRAHELAPNIPQVHLVRANVLLARREYKQVLDEYDEFLRLVPQGPLAELVRQRQAQLRQHMANAQR